MSCDNDTVNYVFNNDYVFNNYRELTSALRELKEENLIEEETSFGPAGMGPVFVKGKCFAPKVVQSCIRAPTGQSVSYSTFT